MHFPRQSQAAAIKFSYSSPASHYSSNTILTEKQGHVNLISTIIHTRYKALSFEGVLALRRENSPKLSLSLQMLHKRFSLLCKILQLVNLFIQENNSRQNKEFLSFFPTLFKKYFVL